MKKKKIYIIVGIIIVLLLAAGSFALIKNYSAKNKQLLSVGKCYDSNKQEMDCKVSTLSVVGGVEGVKYITLDITILNRDIVPLTFRVKSMTPGEVNELKPTGTLNLSDDSYGVFTTGLIDVEPYEGTVQDFCVTVISEAIPALREESNRSECISIPIDPNPEGNFEILGVESSTSGNDDNGFDPECDESWECSDWGECDGEGIQERSCTDLSDCGTEINKPPTERICETPRFSTNAVNGEYNFADVWIQINGVLYTRQGISSYDCLTENIILYTPEGNAVCSRPGYDVLDRVYLQYGYNGIIFSTS